MKTFLATLLVLFLSIPVVRADSPDGNAIACDDRFGNTRYIAFQNGYAVTYQLGWGLPVKIETSTVDQYFATPDSIMWQDSMWLNTLTLNRKTLELTGVKTMQCQLITLEEIITILENYIEEANEVLKEEMKDNKL